MTITSYVQQNWAWLVGAVVGLAGWINLWVTKRRSRRAFAYKVLIDSPLIGHQEAAGGKVQIMFGGREVSNVRLIEVELRSIGGREIASSDFDHPITLQFPDDAEVLDASISDHFPSDFIPEIEVNSISVILKPKVMNPGDWLKIKALVVLRDGFRVKVRGHIAGIPEIIDKQPIWTRGNVIRATIPIWSVAAMALFIYALSSLPQTPSAKMPHEGFTRAQFATLMLSTALIGTIINSILVFREEKAKRSAA